MAKRNANGIGSVTFNKSRKRWEARITTASEVVECDEDGKPTKKRQTRKLVTARTQEEVLERLRDLQTATDISPSLGAETTVAQFLGYWLDEVLPHADISAVTLDGYTRMVNLYLVPLVGRVRLDQLAPSHVRGMLKKLETQGLSPNTRRQARSVLRRALRTAEADGLVTRNVAAIVDGVKVGKPTGRTLTPDQARTLLTAAQDHEYGALLTVLLSLGLRRGEALALSWPALDLDATPATLTVKQSLKIAADYTTFIDSPKTAGSRRRLHLPAPVVDVLRSHRARQAEQRLEFGKRSHRARQAEQRLEFGKGWGGDWKKYDLVFTSSVGTPLDPHRVGRAIKKMTTEALGEAWTPHEMRHSAASLLLAQNVPLKTISDMLGHSSIRVTADIYGHLLEPAKTEASDAMTTALWGSS